MSAWDGDVMRHHLNHIILDDGTFYRVFERLGKTVPLEAYNPRRHLGKGLSVEEAVENSDVPVWDIEMTPYKVSFNE